MRHLVKGRKLGRTASHRKATMMALSVALIKSERIVTTLAKAKALRSYVEPIITRSKEDSTHNRSHVFRHLRDKQATSRLFDEIAPMVADRPGGYTRIVKLGIRQGDGAEKALIELVDFNDAQPETARKKKRRTRRAGSGKKAADKPAEAKKQTAGKKVDKDKAAEEKASAGAKAKAVEQAGDTVKDDAGLSAKDAGAEVADAGENKELKAQAEAAPEPAKAEAEKSVEPDADTVDPKKTDSKQVVAKEKASDDSDKEEQDNDSGDTKKDEENK
jgi:large subunit ribosomal protein L17